MANNSITSNTAVVAGSCGTAGNGTVGLTFTALKQRTLGGINLYIQQTGTSALTLIPAVIPSNIGTAASFFFTGTSGIYGTTMLIGKETITVPLGTANYRIPLPVMPCEHTVILSAQYGSLGSNNTAIIDFADEGMTEVGGMLR